MRHRHTSPVSRSRRVSIPASAFAPPNNLWDKLAQALGLKQF